MVRIVNEFYNPDKTKVAFLKTLRRTQIIETLKEERNRTVNLPRKDNIKIIHKNERRMI